LLVVNSVNIDLVNSLAFDLDPPGIDGDVSKIIRKSCSEKTVDVSK